MKPRPEGLPPSRRVLGIDPGTVRVGYGIVERSGSALRYVAGGCILARADSLSARLLEIHTGLQVVIEKYAPAVAAIETVFGGKNIKTAIAIGEGRGVAVLSAAEAGLAVIGYEPALVKRAIAGSGRAGKEQIQEMVRVLLGLREIPPTDHEADALALAITHSQREMTGLAVAARAAPARRSRKGARRNRRRQA